MDKIYSASTRKLSFALTEEASWALTNSVTFQRQQYITPKKRIKKQQKQSQKLKKNLPGQVQTVSWDSLVIK